MQRHESLFYKFALLLGLLSVLQSGCAPYYVKISPKADIHSIKTVAIWKFSSVTLFRNADSVMPQAFEEAFKQNGFTVIEAQKLSDAVGEITPDFLGVGSLDIPALNREALKTIRDETGTDAILIGKIKDYSYHSDEKTRYPRIEFAFQLLDTRSGETIMHGRLMKID